MSEINGSPRGMPRNWNHFSDSYLRMIQRQHNKKKLSKQFPEIKWNKVKITVVYLDERPKEKGNKGTEKQKIN